ncbi:MAG: hypothetical protein U9P72_02960 [Campylobacterota bacterium]|nr:hypothetical protein [Campylobacterota bacterium]
MRFLLLFLLTFSYLYSAPAFSILRDFKQADGTAFKAQAQGNQHLNWIETQDGEILKYNNKSKNFEYANIKNSTLRASGVRFEKNNSKRLRSINRINKIDKKELYQLWAKKRKENRLRKGF